MNEYRMTRFLWPTVLLVMHALDLVIYALDPVNHALHLVALRGAGSFPPARTLGRI